MAIDVKAHWRANPGQQEYALAVDGIGETLYGGARGGGKTDAGMVWMVKPPHITHPLYRGLVIRRNADDLIDWVDRAKRMFAPLRPEVQGKPAEFRFPTGAIIRTGHLKDADAYTKYQGHEYQRILVEELQQIAFEKNYLTLIASCRSTVEIDGAPLQAQVFNTANPGGKGHHWIKKRWRIGQWKPNVAYRIDGKLRMYIPATVDDNPVVQRVNPEYIQFLESLPEPLRSAWRFGRWDIYTGQAFDFGQEHIVDPRPVPEYAQIVTTFDWGFGKPFSWGWWWIDSDGRFWRFAEWYGCSGVPDVGLRLKDSDVAEGIIERERKLGIDPSRVFRRFAGPDCFSKKPDHRGGGQGPSTAETFAEHGIYLTAGDPARSVKIRQFRERLSVRRDARGRMTELPMMVVYKTCHDFIRVIPSLVMDEINVEDVDTDQEDHPYDEACHICMWRNAGSGEVGRSEAGAADRGDARPDGAKDGPLF